MNHIPFQGILGSPYLQSMGFTIYPDGKSVMIDGIKIKRLTEDDIKRVMLTTNCVHRSDAKLLCSKNSVYSKLPQSESTFCHNSCVTTIANGTYTSTANLLDYSLREIRCSSQKCDNQHKSINIKGAIEKTQESANTDVCDQDFKSKVITLGVKYKESSYEDSSPRLSITERMQVTRIQVNIKMDHLKPYQQHELTNLICKMSNLFSKNDHDIGCFTATDNGSSKVKFHVIDNSETCYAISRRVPHAQRTWLEQHLEESCKNGVISEINYSDSTVQISPVLIVPKKGKNRYRMAVDYRQLNNNLRPATCPLPNIKDCLESLAKKRIFSALDITSAFNQFELDEERKNLTGFVTLGRIFITNRMPFGAKPSPEISQKFMKRALRDVPEEYCICYLDDILVASENWDDHLEHLKHVFQELLRHGLKLSPNKCSLAQDSLEYLGFFISRIDENQYGYAPSPDKVTAIKNCSLPTTAKDVRAFCGSLQYYNNMIPDLNIMLSPLHKGASAKEFLMTQTMKEAFNKVQIMLSNRILLAFPNFELPFKLSTDASFAGASGVLSQVYPNGNEEIIYLFSKAFDSVQTKWAIVELECLALVWSLEKMRTLLFGRPFVWLTDSLVLKQIIENPPKDEYSRSARKLCRFIDVISEFDIELRHEKGTHEECQLADYLSRSPILTVSNLFRAQLTIDE